jgi:hypothetical protein
MSGSEWCKEMIRGDWGRHQCSRKATTADGYCTQHSPAKKAERRAKSQARVDEEHQKREAIFAQAALLDAQVEAVTSVESPVRPSRHVVSGWMPGAVEISVEALRALLGKAEQ